MAVGCIDAGETAAHYVREPFDKEPDFKATNGRYDLEILLPIAEDPV